jgi:hypothetical protein
MSKIYYSIDYDGTLDRNLDKFVEWLTKESEDSVEILNGSSRRTAPLDFANQKRNKNGSCFLDLKKLVDLTNQKISNKAKLNRFTICDLITGQKFGTNYDFVEKWYETKDENDNTYLQSKKHCFSDEYKIALILSQLYAINKENPNDTIIFRFIDDRSHDILPVLYSFFSKNPEKIPKNVTLELFQMTGKQLQPFEKPIIGSGDPDTNLPEKLQCIAKFYNNEKISDEEKITEAHQLHLQILNKTIEQQIQDLSKINNTGLLNSLKNCKETLDNFNSSKKNNFTTISKSSIQLVNKAHKAIRTFKQIQQENEKQLKEKENKELCDQYDKLYEQIFEKIKKKSTSSNIDEVTDKILDDWNTFATNINNKNKIEIIPYAMKEMKKLNLRLLKHQIYTVLDTYKSFNENEKEKYLSREPLRDKLVNFHAEITYLLSVYDDTILNDVKKNTLYQKITAREKLINNTEDLLKVTSEADDLVNASNDNPVHENLKEIGRSIFTDLYKLTNKVIEDDILNYEPIKKDIEEINTALDLNKKVINSIKTENNKEKDANIKKLKENLKSRTTNTTAAKIFIFGATIIGSIIGLPLLGVGAVGSGVGTYYFARSLVNNFGIFNHYTERDTAQYNLIKDVQSTLVR